MDGIREVIKSKQALYGFKNQDMAILLHWSTSKWEKRLSKPESFKLFELEQVKAILHISSFGF